MKTIFIVSSGEYEQRGPIFAAPTRELAELAATRLGHSVDDVDELPCYETPDEVFSRTLYMVQLRADGLVCRRSMHDWPSYLGVVEHGRDVGGRGDCRYEGQSCMSDAEAERLAREAMGAS